MRTLEITAPDRVLYLAGDGETEALYLPGTVETVFGLGLFPELRHLAYPGSGDLLGIGELLEWMNKPARDDEVFGTRLATNLRAAAPVSPRLAVFDAPAMALPCDLPGYGGLMIRCEDIITRAVGYGRQEVCLCALTLGQLKQLEFALRFRRDFTAEEQVLHGLGLELGWTWREFHSVTGEHDYRHLRTKEAWMAFLRRLPLRDGSALRRPLETMLRTGVLNGDNYPAAVELLGQWGLTESVAFLLDHGSRRGWNGAASLDTEFAL